MTTNTRNNDTNCPPAEQPKEPGREDCKPPDPIEPPELEEPKRCEPDCECPHPPVVTPTCLDDLIADQKREIAEAVRATEFKKELEQLQINANAAIALYTQVKYEKWLEDWKFNDAAIVDLIRQVKCATPCWRCLIECYVCPLIEDIRVRKVLLYGDGSLPAGAKTLYDLLHWHERNAAAAQRRYDRVKEVLAAWEKPAIDKVLLEVTKLIGELRKLGDPVKAVYDLFLKIIPLHLAIAPPAATAATAISAEYTDFCECDVGQPDDCCGPDVGIPSVRHRLLGAEYMYLVQPSEYFDVICCLTKTRYLPAKDALSKAVTERDIVKQRIADYLKDIDDLTKNVEKSAKGAFPVDCKDWEDDCERPNAPAAR